MAMDREATAHVSDEMSEEGCPAARIQEAMEEEKDGNKAAAGILKQMTACDGASFLEEMDPGFGARVVMPSGPTAVAYILEEMSGEGFLKARLLEAMEAPWAAAENEWRWTGALQPTFWEGHRKKAVLQRGS